MGRKSLDNLSELFNYSDGKLYWKVSPSKRVKIGDEAGHLQSNGYTLIGYRGKTYYRHNIVYALHTGIWPAEIDHKDEDTTNDRFENLRPLSHMMNMHNSSKFRGTVPHRGVDLVNGRYRARLCINYRKRLIGIYDTPEEASKAYVTYKSQMLPEITK